jgi:hypothetical protein
MDYLIILLGTLLVVIIVYMLYTNYFSSTTKLSGEIDMKDKTADITVDKLTKPDSTRYSYNIWIYVDKPVSGSRTIFDRANDLGLFLNGDTSTLEVRLYRRAGTANAVSADNAAYQLSNNLPLQKWVYVTVSVDNSTIDMYLDGKLVKSAIAERTTTGNKYHRPDATSPIKFGVNPGTYMTKFNRKLGPSDPQTTWSSYMEGSGSAMGLSSLANRYNINLAISKDNIISNTISLW